MIRPLVRSRSAFRSTVLLLLLMAPVACDSGSTGPGGTRIGPEGGDVTLAGGAVELSVPPDALATPIEFSAVLATSFTSSDLIVPGTVYDIGPAGTSFDRLVRLTLSYNPQQIPESVQESELRLFQAVGNGWELATNASVDTDANTVFGTVSSTGQFAVMGRPVATVSLTPSYYTVEVGGTKRLTGIGLDASGTSLPGRALSWSSNNEDVATVDGEGVVTATGVGSALITATVEGKSSSTMIQTWSCSAQDQVPAAECEAVIDLYFLAEDDWRLTPSWVSDPSPCEWRGVTCTDGTISEVYIYGRGLEGAIPNSIGDLTGLTFLGLPGNHLSGFIPNGIGTLTSLEELDLFGNDLTGAIPSALQNLSNLRVLNLGNNELTGSIPPGLGTLSNLTELNLGWNQISGTIPPELGDMSNLSILQLIDNQLAGSVPPELGGLAELTELSISYNLLTGQIPPELGNLANLVRLSLGQNQLSGSIPAEIGNLALLDGLYLAYNTLSGVVPLGVAQIGGQIQARSGGASNCALAPENPGLSIPDTEDYRNADLNGDGEICGVAIGS